MVLENDKVPFNTNEFIIFYIHNRVHAWILYTFVYK